VTPIASAFLQAYSQQRSPQADSRPHIAIDGQLTNFSVGTGRLAAANRPKSDFWLAAVRVEHDQAFAVERLIDVGVEAVCRQVGLEHRLPLEIWQTEDRRANSSVDGMPQHGTDATSGMATR
jgi:hypothetical protein